MFSPIQFTKCYYILSKMKKKFNAKHILFTNDGQ